MERTEARQTGLRIDNIRPLIRLFFQRITGRQWKLLKCGVPDEATKILLVEMILDIISAVTKNLLAALGKAKTPDNQKRILSSLDQLLRQSLGKALAVPNKVNNTSLKSLSHIIQTEVKENVTMALSNQRVIDPAKLEIMLCHTTKIFKVFAAKIEVFVSPRPSRERRESFFCTDEKDKLDMKTHPEQPDTDGGSGDGFTEQHLQTLLKKIQKELMKIFPPLLNDMSETEWKKLRSVASAALHIFAAEISTLLREKGMTPCSFKAVSAKLKRMFTACFLTVWLHRLMGQLNRQHHGNKPHQHHTSRSAEALIDCIKSQFPGGYGLEDCFTHWLRDLSRTGAVLFTKELSDLIYFDVMPEITGASNLEAKISRRFYILWTYSRLYADIRSKVWIFMVMMNWKLKQLSVRFSHKVELAVTESAERPIAGETPGCQNKQQDANLERERNKRRVRVFIEKIVCHLQHEGRMMADNRYEIINGLLDKVWAEVKDAHICVTPDSFKNLDKKIHKHLCQRFGTPEMALFLINCKDPDVTKSIVVMFEKHLIRQSKEPLRLSRIFSPLGSVLCKSSGKSGGVQ